MCAIRFGVCLLDAFSTGPHTMRAIKRWFNGICRYRHSSMPKCILLLFIYHIVFFKYIFCISDNFRSFLIFTGGMLVFVSICCLVGVLIYSHYQHCDPLNAKLIAKDDQLFPLYVMQTAGNVWGLPGLFIAGVCGAALRYIIFRKNIS